MQCPALHQFADSNFDVNVGNKVVSMFLWNSEFEGSSSEAFVFVATSSKIRSFDSENSLLFFPPLCLDCTLVLIWKLHSMGSAANSETKYEH